MGDFFRVNAVVFIFAAVDGLEIERMGQYEGELGVLAGIGEPIPAEHAFGANSQVVPIGRNELEEVIEVIVLDVGMDELFSLPVHHADVHLPGVEVDSAVELCGRCVVFHNGSFVVGS